MDLKKIEQEVIGNILSLGRGWDLEIIGIGPQISLDRFGLVIRIGV